MNKSHIGFLVLLALGSTLCQQKYDCSPNCISCSSSTCLGCYTVPFKDIRTCDSTDPGDHCAIYEYSENVKRCTACKVNYILDIADNTCNKPKFAVIPNCLDQYLINDANYCTTCKNSYPNPLLLFKACVPFPKSGERVNLSIPEIETLVKQGLPQEFVEILKKKEQKKQNQDAMTSGQFDNCLWGTVSGTQKQYINCFRCKPGYVQHAGGCIINTITGCLEIGIQKKKCVFCDVYDGYYGRSNDGTCTKDNTSAVSLQYQ